MARGAEFAGPRSFLHAFQAIGLRLAAAFRQRFRHVGEQHGKPQPQADDAGKTGIALKDASGHRHGE